MYVQRSWVALAKLRDWFTWMQEIKGAGVDDREKVSNDRESKSVADDAGKYYIIH